MEMGAEDEKPQTPQCSYLQALFVLVGMLGGKITITRRTLEAVGKLGKDAKIHCKYDAGVDAFTLSLPGTDEPKVVRLTSVEAIKSALEMRN